MTQPERSALTSAALDYDTTIIGALEAKREEMGERAQGLGALRPVGQVTCHFWRHLMSGLMTAEIRMTANRLRAATMSALSSAAEKSGCD
jgi:hypothetical protein